MDGGARQRLYEDILKWFASRNHKIALSVLDNCRASSLIKNRHPWLRVPYAAAGLHLALQVQRLNQGKPKNKGKTLLVYDQQRQYEAVLSELIADPPGETDGYCGSQPGLRLSAIIDTVYFVRSHHASFIHLADLIAFVARRRAELLAFDSKDRFPGESKQLQRWWRLLRPYLLDRRHVLPAGETSFVSFVRETFVDVEWWTS